MPIFEYKCSKCDSVFEIFLKSRNEEVECINCGSKDVKKLFSKFNAVKKEKTVSKCQSCPNTNCPNKNITL